MDDIHSALGALIEPGGVFEIRIIEPLNGYGTRAGYFNNIETAAKAAASWSGKCSAVYATLNPVKPDLLARAANRIKKLGKQDRTTADADMTARRWFPLDLDPVRPSGISSTDAEHAAAIAKAREARDWLAAQGWPAPILADSGNGAHLLYRINLPNDEASKHLVERAIKALAHKLDDREGQKTPVRVDQSVFNAARIWKVYGTLAAKGDNTQDRPHRLAKIIEAPDAPALVSLAQLQAFAALAPEDKKPEPPKPRADATGGDFFSHANDRAMSSLAAWVPALFPAATTYRDGYRVTSKALGRDLEEALSILPAGIKDFGLHDQGDAQGGKRTPIDLVIEHGGEPDAKRAAFWLCRQLGIEPRSLGWEEKGRPPDARFQQPNAAHSEPPPADAAYLDALGQRTPPAPSEWPDPCPLPVEAAPVPPFPPEVLPESLRPWIADIAERLQCPPDYPAVGGMICLAAVVGRKIGIRPKRHDDWLVVPNLWGLIVGRPGVLKSPALQEAMKPILPLEMEAKNQHALAQAEADANKAVADARRKVSEARIRDAIKKGGDPYEIARLSMGGERPAVRRRYLVNDSSVEKLGELLNENPNGLLVFRDELLGLLCALERDGQEGARQFYLESWNGTGRFTYDRIGRGTVDIEACCLSILGSIQPGPLQDYLATAPDDGLMQRFQLAVWPDLDAGWTDVDRWPDQAAKDRAWKVFKRLNDLAPLAVCASPAEGGNIPYLRFAPDAQVEFSRWRAALETRLRTEELHPALETCLAKYRSLIPSLALLIHLADSPEGGPIALPPLLKACAWGEYLEAHARRIYSARTAPALLSAMRLAAKIKDRAIKDAFTLRDVYRPAWSRLTTVEQAQAAANVLIDHDWLRAGTETTQGRPRASYRINPKVWEMRA